MGETKNPDNPVATANVAKQNMFLRYGRRNLRCAPYNMYGRESFCFYKLNNFLN